MIKATGMVSGRPTIFLGLSHGNLRKFVRDDDTYILIKKEDMGLPWDILIFAGETERAMADRMKNGIGPDTIIHMSDKVKEQFR